MRPWSDVPASALVVLELGALVLGLALLARLARRAGLSPIPLYLLVGLAFGTGGVMPLSLIEDHVALGADIGVILLMLLLGLQYTGQELSDGLRNGWQAGLVDLALNFTPGLLLGLALGWDPVAAVLLAGVTFNTSSGVMAKVLTDLGRLGNRETVPVLTMSVMEDLINALYLPLVAVLLVGVGLAQGAVSIAVALVTVVVVLIFALRFGETLSRAVINPSEEVVLLTVFGLVLVVAGIAESLQVSSAIGPSYSALPCPERWPTGPARCWPPCATCSPRCSSSPSACRWSRPASPRSPDSRSPWQLLPR